ncbi:DUF1207 domain-containing protein [Siphonobacter sp. SORGH_AS_1065]|uniref:DUF1207 domain-containing protein n=1 Tax=Siphonobacter sp. SORGH_AS_1065 TaxID=3041795 RepID=UPI0027831E39|nr:DUF1207 domain-containing protein [Siphonobacter sp. SORGH_AS_1065]MDQ1085947.1 hypothetical protein [Siphonobacter sp. SORGH_AS_1065]
MRSIFTLTGAFFLLITGAFAQTKTEFLPKGRLFDPILLDPLEAKTSAFLIRRTEDGVSKKGLFAPFSIGIQKSFFRWSKDEGHASELALDVVANTQFEMFHDSKEDRFRRYMYNVDYRVGLMYNLRRDQSSWRFRIFHLSSHLGDDYLIRNQLIYFTPNAVNYEQIDALYSRNIQSVRLYGGAGMSLRPSSERKRLYTQLGLVWKQPNRQKSRWWAGLDARMIEQTNFHPGITAAFGIELGEAERGPLSIAIQAFHGPLPFSAYEQRINNWVGLGFYLNPF